LESIVYRLSALSYFSQFSGPENENQKGSRRPDQKRELWRLFENLPPEFDFDF
jgi:hypothetical protein